MPGDSPVEIAVRQDGRGLVITVAGEVDIATSPELRDACLEAVNNGAGPVGLDLGGVTFLDSSGISVLVQARQRLAAMGRGLELRAVSRPVRRVFEVSGLAAIFALAPEAPDS
jgi:anti-sigma B factor antagonist